MRKVSLSTQRKLAFLPFCFNWSIFFIWFFVNAENNKQRFLGTAPVWLLFIVFGIPVFKMVDTFEEGWLQTVVLYIFSVIMSFIMIGIQKKYGVPEKN